MQYPILDSFSQTASRICFKFSVDGWTPTKFVKIGLLPLLTWDFG